MSNTTAEQILNERGASGGGRRVYLAGPMSGLPDDNVPAFLAAGADLRARGWDVVIPCEGHADQATDSWEGWMRKDIALVLGVEGLALLPGWERSRGACREVTVALTLGMPLFDALTMEPIPLDAACARLEVARLLLLRWSRERFPSRRVEPTREHLHRELRELADAPADRLEVADVLMLAFALADVEGIDPAAAILDKLEVVQARTWGEPDAHGVVEHVRTVEVTHAG